MTFALIDASGVVVDTAPEEFKVHPSFTWADTGTSGAVPGWTYSNGVFAAPVVPAADVKMLARGALDASDVTILRCYEHGVAVPAEWSGYRAALRGIISGSSAATELPARPAFPAGT